MEASWAATGQGLIGWPAGAIGPVVADSWHRPDRPVTIRPVDIQALLADLAAAVTGIPVHSR